MTEPRRKVRQDLYLQYVAGLWEPPHFDGLPGPDRVDAPECSPAEIAAFNAERWRERADHDPELSPGERSVLHQLAGSAEAYRRYLLAEASRTVAV